MSFHILTKLNYPPLVATAGGAILIGLPFVEAVAASSTSLALLKGTNVAAFLSSLASVSVPGRLDGPQDAAMRKGTVNPAKPTGIKDGESKSENSPLVDGGTANTGYNVARTRGLVNPSGWAFTIWGPIYLGEAVFVVAQAMGALDSVVPEITAPFVAALLLQNLWCASFRPKYSDGWRKYVSCGMLAGTAYSLSLVHTVGLTTSGGGVGWYFLPITIHMGWMTAATFVNLNGAVAMEESSTDSAVVAVGHASALLASAVGVGVTVLQGTPAYGLTLAWALAACADGMQKRETNGGNANQSDTLKTGARVQKFLCWSGSAACVIASVAAAGIL